MMSAIAGGPSLLLVADDERLRFGLAEALTDRGYEVYTAPDYAGALVRARNNPPEMAVVDLHMPGRAGLALIGALKEIDPETRIVVLTGYGSRAAMLDDMQLGAVHYVQKPADADEILAAFAKGAQPLVIEAADTVYPPAFERVRWEYMSHVLADCEGDVSEAARRLKMHHRSLQRMLQKFSSR